MNPTPFNQILSNNQKEIIAGVFLPIATIITGVLLLISIAMSKHTSTPVVYNYTYTPAYSTVNEAAPAAAPVYRAACPVSSA